MINLRKQPLLVNAAEPGTHSRAGQWTRHEYIGSEDITTDSDPPVSGIAHMFRCLETGAVRQYGFDSHYAQGEKNAQRSESSCVK